MLVYLMGRPHSGSTILDVVLGNSTAIESVGELVSGGINRERACLCSCGSLLEDCVFWRRVLAVVSGGGRTNWRRAVGASIEQAHVACLFATWRAPVDHVPPAWRELVDINARIAAGVAAASGKPHMLDSSKEPTRALFLLKFVPTARVIHLVRDPLRVVASHYWRSVRDGGYFHFLRRKYHQPLLRPLFMLLAASGWAAGNLVCEFVTRAAPGRVLRVRYEDLVADPRAELDRIGRFLGVELTDVASEVIAGKPLAVGHNLGGNRMQRERRTICLDGSKGQAHALPWLLSMATLVLCWPLMLRYGYGLGVIERSLSSGAQASKQSTS